jgi:hypothetical protein
MRHIRDYNNNSAESVRVDNDPSFIRFMVTEWIKSIVTKKQPDLEVEIDFNVKKFRGISTLKAMAIALRDLTPLRSEDFEDVDVCEDGKFIVMKRGQSWIIRMWDNGDEIIVSVLAEAPDTKRIATKLLNTLSLLYKKYSK